MSFVVPALAASAYRALWPFSVVVLCVLCVSVVNNPLSVALLNGSHRALWVSLIPSNAGLCATMPVALAVPHRSHRAL